MNERIKLLIEQATIVVVPSVGEFAGHEFHQLDPEKFAELIVKECAEAADQAHAAQCAYPGDYIGEYMGYGQEQGVAAWRSS